ncbi:diaminopimelate decarboxylase [Carboxylicivirga marina]|uniref:Diaminopimelate decarboxylase n=1 Tax=Carboxylicivirga marina TaxID=2800988 RepID=A0ABS1HKI3_9BACT|nr:diaminopimelate decarboxylase [Carboxylicivirga marina]MBK3518187.1 diaminopimelate decarboxylase [Carboxylicivirga marina]
MNFNFPVDSLNQLQTPFYFYDMALLNATLDSVKKEAGSYGFKVHYAVKANANDRILSTIKDAGFGADCVSGNEVKKALETGFGASGVVFAGVGKADWEINLGLDNDIACFNVESIPELEIINELAEKKGKVAKVALRINPNVNANTHHYITTGLEENKFGINQWDLENVIDALAKLKNVELEGLHFHIGSQITDLMSFKDLCLRVNELQKWFISHQICPKVVNVGGGLGIDYEQPDSSSIPDFKSFFKLFDELLELKPGQELHFELGRSMVGQCGALLSKVLYVKNGVNTKFAIVDAGMSDLIRPALYQAYHKIENLTSNKPSAKYDVVGPICESSDCFGKAVDLPETGRGDLIAIRSAGAYGEIMANRYNLRELPLAYYSDEI